MPEDDETREVIEEQTYSWLEVHKKSALSYLVLEALSEHAMWSKDLTDWIVQTSGWTITERGLYRLLRRMQSQGTIAHTAAQAARTGAERKTYHITDDGTSLLRAMRAELKYLRALPGRG